MQEEEKANKTEDGIVRRLAKNGLIGKDKVKAAQKSSKKKKKKKKGVSSSSSSYSDSSSSSIDSSSDSGDSSGDSKKKKSRKNKSRRDNNDKPSAKAKSKAKKENKIQKLTQSMEEAQKGILQTATELRELRGVPKAIQKQFDEHQERSEGKDKGKPEPLLTMSQWKELLASNKKATSLPPNPVKDSRLDSSYQPVRI